MVSLWRNNACTSPWQRSHRSPKASTAVSHGDGALSLPLVGRRWLPGQAGSTPPSQCAPLLD